MSSILNMMGLTEDYSDIFNEYVSLYDEANELIGNKPDLSASEDSDEEQITPIASPHKVWLNVNSKNKNKNKNNKKQQQQKNKYDFEERTPSSDTHIATPQMFKFGASTTSTPSITLEVATGITNALAKGHLDQEKTIVEIQKLLDNFVATLSKAGTSSKLPGSGILGSVFGKTDTAASEFITSSKGEINTLMQSLSSKFSDVGETARSTIMLILLTAVLMVALRDDRKLLFLVTIPLFVGLIGPEKLLPLIRSLKERVSSLALVVHDLTSLKIDEGEVEAQPQAQEQFAFLSALPGLLFGKEAVSSLLDPKVSFPMFIIKNYRTSKQSIEDMMTLLTSAVKFLLSSTGYGAFYDQIASKFLCNDNSFSEYTKEIFDIEMLMSQKKFNFTTDNYNILVEKLIHGEKLLSTINVHKHGNGIFSVMSSTVQRVRSFKKIFDDSGFMVTGLRQEPASVLFRGAPGMFKTQAMQHLCHAVISAVIDDESRAAYMANPELYIYNRLIESEYWDAYTTKHLITIFDDLFQVKDVPGSSTNEAMEVIRAINENTFILHMAELSAKGNTHFNSKFVFATSNSPSLDSNSIVDKRALLRRFDHVFTVEPHPDHVLNKEATGMTAKFDKTTLPMGPLGVTSTRPDKIIQFRRFDLLTQTSSSEILTFAEVVSSILETYAMKKLYFEQKLLELAARREEYTPSLLNLEYPCPSLDTAKVEPQIGLTFFKKAADLVSSTLDFGPSTISKDVLRERIVEMMDVDTAMNKPIQSSFQKGGKIDLTLDKAVEWIFDLCEDEGYSFYAKHLESMHDIHLEEHVRVLYYILNHASALNKNMSHQTLLKLMLKNFGESRIMGLKFHCLLAHNKYQISDLVTYDYFSHEDISSYTHSTGEMVKSYYTGVKNRFAAIKANILKSKIYIFYKKYSTLIHLSILLPAIFYGIRTIYKYFTGSELEVTSQSGNGSKSRSKAQKKIARKVVRKNFSNVFPQVSLSDDTQCRDILLKVIKGNSYELFLSESREEKFDKCGQVVFVHDNVCLMPHHFVDLFNDLLEQGHMEARVKLVSLYSKSIDSATTEMYLKDFLGYSENGCSQVMDSNNLMTQDLTLVKVENMVNRPSLMKFISNESYVQSLRTRLTCMIAKNSNVAEIISVPTNIVSEVIVSSEEYESYTIPKSFIYNVATKKGDCGAIVAIADTANSIAKICGMHVAGTPQFGRGYAAIFTREDIIEAFRVNGREKDLDGNKSVVLVAENQCEQPLFSKFMVAEEGLPKITIPTRTKIMKSPLHNVVTESFMKPSVLSAPSTEPETTNPWMNAYSSYNMQTSMASSELLTDAMENYADMLFYNSEVVKNPKIYSFDEAIVGIEGTTFKSMSRKTSPGFPDCLDPRIKTTGRKFYFGSGDEYDLTGENVTKLRKEVHEIIEKAEQGMRSKHVYVDYLKDELRDVAKVKACKTRLFSASPLRLLIAYRMYFGEFQRWYSDNRINNQSAVGVNVYSAETEIIVQMLNKFAVEGTPTVGAGDFKGFDGSENSSIHKKSLEVIQKFYNGNEKENTVREILWLELTNSLHYFNGNLIEWTASLPSGHPMTTIVNNMYNGIAFRYCWNRAFEGTQLQHTFNENAWLITQGDDNVFCVRSDLTETFNEAVVSKYMAELGLNYTKEDKTTADSTLRTVHQVEFLKRKWTYNPKIKRHVAPLRLNRLLETLAWTKDSPVRHEIPRDNVNTILHELSLHGKEVFDSWAPKIIEASKEHLDFHPKNTSYTSLIRTVANMELII